MLFWRDSLNLKWKYLKYIFLQTLVFAKINSINPTQDEG